MSERQRLRATIAGSPGPAGPDSATIPDFIAGYHNRGDWAEKAGTDVGDVRAWTLWRQTCEQWAAENGWDYFAARRALHALRRRAAR